MRKEFPGYFKPTRAQAKAVWTTGLFVFDANALLNVYRYTEGTRKDLLSAMKSIGDRIRIPYQVADEFFQNRTAVIGDQRSAYRDVMSSIDTAQQSIEKIVEKHRRHALLVSEQLRTLLAKGLEPLRAEVRRLQGEHPDLLSQNDSLLEELADIVGQYMLPRRTDEELAADHKWAKARIEANIPPGFKDKGKPDGGHGDALIWREIIELAKSAQQPIIFVSDDQKEDWVLEIEGKKLGALPALRQELFKEAGQDFVHLSVKRFLAQSQSNQQPVSQKSIAEAETVGDELNRAGTRNKSFTAKELATLYHLYGKDALSPAVLEKALRHRSALDSGSLTIKDGEITSTNNERTFDTTAIRVLREAGLKVSLNRLLETRRNSDDINRSIETLHRLLDDADNEGADLL